MTPQAPAPRATEPPPQNDMDRGAMAVLDLLARSMDYAIGEESYAENAESIRAAIAMDGLAAVIARQRDSELDFVPEDERDEFPEHLAALASDIPKTVWRFAMQRSCGQFHKGNINTHRPLIEAAIRDTIYAEDTAEYERPLLRDTPATTPTADELREAIEALPNEFAGMTPDTPDGHEQFGSFHGFEVMRAAVLALLEAG